MPRPAPSLALSSSQKAELEGLVRSGNTPQNVAQRCRLPLLAHEGVANQAIAEQLELSRPTVLALRDTSAKDGLAAVTGVRRRHRRGSVLTPELEQKIIDTTDCKDSPRRRQHALECADAGETAKGLPNHRSPGLAAS